MHYSKQLLGNLLVYYYFCNEKLNIFRSDYNSHNWRNDNNSILFLIDSNV